MNATARIGDKTPPAQRLRLRWAENLDDELRVLGFSRQQFRQALAEVGCDVTRQAIDQWLAGKTAPRAHHQHAIGLVCRKPPHQIFNTAA